MHLNSLNVLVTCERSGTIRNSFARAGNNAWSVDTLPTTAPTGIMSNPETGSTGSAEHATRDALDFLPFGAQGTGWDIVIARPPCTFLTNSGVRWLFEETEKGSGVLTDRAIARWTSLRDAIDFFNAMRKYDTGFYAIENPIPHRYARLGIAAGLAELDIEKPELAALVRRNIPAHIAESTAAIGAPTQVVQPWMFGHPEKKATAFWLKDLPPLVPTNDVREAMKSLPKKVTDRVHYASPGEDRWMQRSLLVQGMADAMVEQWGRHVEENIDWDSSASSQGFIETGRRNTKAETEEYTR